MIWKIGARWKRRFEVILLRMWGLAAYFGPLWTVVVVLDASLLFTYFRFLPSSSCSRALTAYIRGVHPFHRIPTYTCVFLSFILILSTRIYTMHHLHLMAPVSCTYISITRVKCVEPLDEILLITKSTSKSLH